MTVKVLMEHGPKPSRSKAIATNAVLLSPKGKLVGKYRKICPARGEYHKGIAPGCQFSVFNTDVGKIGMMICFDVHMPEVDLSEQYFWRANMGEFKGRLRHERPVVQMPK